MCEWMNFELEEWEIGEGTTVVRMSFSDGWTMNTPLTYNLLAAVWFLVPLSHST